MKEQRHGASKDNMAKDRQAAPAPISSLIADLASDDSVIRVKARRALVSSGDKAVEPLIKALTNPNQWVRWEAAKALGQIANKKATNALINALEDKMFDVRWLAAEGLITIGPEVIKPLLQALIERADSVWMREGAHHVLHDVAKGDLEEIVVPVLTVLEDLDAPVEVPFAAKSALNKLK